MLCNTGTTLLIATEEHTMKLDSSPTIMLSRNPRNSYLHVMPLHLELAPFSRIEWKMKQNALLPMQIPLKGRETWRKKHLQSIRHKALPLIPVLKIPPPARKQVMKQLHEGHPGPHEESSQRLCLVARNEH